MSEWIAVDERKPDDGEYVIVSVGRHVINGSYDDSVFHYNATNIDPRLDVDAWMPLPEPYDPKKKEDVNDYTVGNPFWLKDEIKEGCNYRLLCGGIVDFYAVNDKRAEIYSDVVSDGKSYALYKLDEGKIKIYKIHDNDQIE